MVIEVALSPVTEQRLREKAATAGKPVGEVVRETLEQNLDRELISDGLEERQKLYLSRTPEERARVWREWAAGRPAAPGVAIDDSRESIYDGRGE